MLRKKLSAGAPSKNAFLTGLCTNNHFRPNEM
ncbi:hypothetical protein Bra471DRAFT_02596 [Bradyrhizobium sp. WSM471]|nr:hypothetical protein Bra471DRAFT_02596 [Bradyrhizobium sp. WSM471]